MSEDYINKDIFHKLVVEYKATRKEEIYNQLYPLLRQLAEMVLYKMGGKKNTDTRMGRIDYEAILQEYYLHWFTALEIYDVKRQALAFFYNDAKLYIINYLRQQQTHKKRQSTVTDMQSNDEDFDIINLVGATEAVDVTNEITEDALLLVEYCRYALENKLVHKRQKLFYLFIIKLFTDVVFASGLNKIKSANTISPIKVLYETFIDKPITLQSFRQKLKSFIKNFKNYEQEKKLHPQKFDKIAALKEEIIKPLEPADIALSNFTINKIVDGVLAGNTLKEVYPGIIRHRDKRRIQQAMYKKFNAPVPYGIKQRLHGK